MYHEVCHSNKCLYPSFKCSTVYVYLHYICIYLQIHYCIYVCTYIGGQPGAFGKNILKQKKDGSLQDLGSKASAQVFPGVSYVHLLKCKLCVTHPFYSISKSFSMFIAATYLVSFSYTIDIH